MTGDDKTGTLIVCHECDTLQNIPRLNAGQTANCICCDARLISNPRGGLDRPYALTLASLILLVIANIYPFITLNIQGRTQSTTLSGAAVSFLNDGRPALAFVTWFTSVLSPALIISFVVYVLTALRFKWKLPGTKPMLSLVSHLQPWGMMDVFMLGVLVSLVKLADLAEIIFGTGLYAFIALIFFFAAALSSLEPHILWQRLEQRS
jgi:paraquat-inducible protein A